MPPKRKQEHEAAEAALDRDTGFVFPGTPEEGMNIEQELEDNVDTGNFDAFKLATVLVMIGERMIGIPLYEYQREPAFRIIYSMLVGDGAEITILYPRQSGKSEVISFCVNVIGILFPPLAKMFPKKLGQFKRGVKMGILAPQLDQVQTVYDRCMERLLSEPVKVFLSDPEISDEALSTVHFKLKSGSTLKGQSAAKQSKVESKTYNIVFLDESQDMDTEKVRRSIVPMTASTNGTIVRTGTPGRYKGDFYYTIQNGKKNDSKLRGKEKLTRQRHFQYDYKDVIKQKNAMMKTTGEEWHGKYEKAILRDIESMGENSDAVRMAYKVEWLLDVGMFVTEKKLEDRCYDKRLNFLVMEDTDFGIAGLDLASARNSTVLTYGKVFDPVMEFGERPMKRIAGWLEIENSNYEDQFQTVCSAIIDNHIKVLYADYTGVGRPFVDMLIHYIGDQVEIIGYMFTPNSKSDMWKALDDDIDGGKLIIPAMASVRATPTFLNFEEQMVNLTKSWRNNNIMVCEKGQGYKDDYCDSLGLFNLAGNHLYTPPTQMEVGENVFFQDQNSHDYRNSRWV